MMRLLEIIDDRRLPPEVARSDSSLREAVAAATEGDTPRALAKLNEFVRSAPQQAVSLRSEPGLEPIRTEVDHMLLQLTALARLDAQVKLDQAAVHLPEKLRDWEAPPQMLATVVQNLIDTGGYFNYICASRLALTLVDQPVPVPSPAATRKHSPNKFQSLAHLASAARRRAGRMWSRAPLLLLLLAWLAIGIIGGGTSLLAGPSDFEFPFELWAVGFLALVLFGFYIRVRSRSR